jgi:hypothetical protein
LNEISDGNDRHHHCLPSDLCGIALGRIPGFRIDRAGIALTGAALMMAIGAITPEEAYRAVNLDTLALLQRRKSCWRPDVIGSAGLSFRQ